jgi:hypothetical protein
MCSYEEEDPQTREAVTITSVEFFNEETLKEFVARKTKREGILQRFIAPKGLRNNVIQAIWSPRLCMVQRRTNRGSIKDKIQCERDPYPVAVTYEGPSHFSEESTCAAHTTDQVKAMCANIAQHFFATEHKYVTRMVLYFKVDERDQLWLLWCGSLRVSDKEQPSEMPLNLAPKFDSPSLEAASPKKEEAELHAADLKHLEMTNDTLFYTTYVKNYEKKDMNSTAGGTTQQQSTVATGKKSGPKDSDKDNAADQQADNEEWHKLPGIQDQYRELCIDRENVLSAFDDIFYEAYGHFLRYDPGPFNFEVDRKVAQTLGVDILQELMQAVKIDHTLPSDDGATTVDDEELCFTVPVLKTGPIKQLGDAVARWVNSYYDRREQELKEEAASAPPAQEETPAENRDDGEDPAAAADESEPTKEAEPAAAEEEKAPEQHDEAPEEKPAAEEEEEAAPANTEPAADNADNVDAEKPADAEAGETPAEPTTAAAEEPSNAKDDGAAKDDTAVADAAQDNNAEADKSEDKPADEDNWMDE